MLPATHRSALHAGPRQEVAPVRAVGGKRARTVPPGQGRVQAGVGGGCVRPAGRWAPGTLLIPVGLQGSLLLDSQHKPWFANCESQPEVTTPTEWVATSISETWYGAGRAHQNTSRSVFGEGGVCVHGANVIPAVTAVRTVCRERTPLNGRREGGHLSRDTRLLSGRAGVLPRVH